MRWQDDPAYGISRPSEADPVSVSGVIDEKTMAVCKGFYRSIKANGVGQGRKDALAMIGEWKAEIEAGRGREWAVANRERFFSALGAAGVSELGEAVYSGAALLYVCRGVFEGSAILHRKEVSVGDCKDA